MSEFFVFSSFSKFYHFKIRGRILCFCSGNKNWPLKFRHIELVRRNKFNWKFKKKYFIFAPEVERFPSLAEETRFSRLFFQFSKLAKRCLINCVCKLIHFWFPFLFSGECPPRLSVADAGGILLKSACRKEFRFVAPHRYNARNSSRSWYVFFPIFVSRPIILRLSFICAYQMTSFHLLEREICYTFRFFFLKYSSLKFSLSRLQDSCFFFFCIDFFYFVASYKLRKSLTLF